MRVESIETQAVGTRVPGRVALGSKPQLATPKNSCVLKKLLCTYLKTYRAVQPQSMAWAEPVMPAAASEHRNVARAATSAGSRSAFRAAGAGMICPVTSSGE